MIPTESEIWSYYNHCYKYAKKILKSHDEAEDVASESIYRLLLIFKSDKSKKADINKIESYINKMVINICKNVKRDNFYKVRFDRFISEEDYVLNFDVFDLNMLTEHFSKGDKKLIDMKLKGYNTKECSNEFNITEINLKVRWHRLKKIIKSEFE
jgi:RNA polymerase sigma factor (sigma-70 family)